MWQPSGVATGWLIRAGEASRHAREFADNQIVALGWPNIPGLYDLRGRSRAEILGLLEASGKSTTPEADANELVAFRDEVAYGDIRRHPGCNDAGVTHWSDHWRYEYEDPSPAGDYRHVRTVHWVGRWDRELVPATLAGELRYRRTIRRLTNQAGWAAVAERIGAGEGRAAGASGPVPTRTVRQRRSSPPAPARRLCPQCMQTLAMSQFCDGSDRCHSCAD